MDATISIKAILANTLLLILVTGTINHIYVSFFGIRRLDRYFSSKPDPSWESRSPFDGFYRLHKYSFLYSLGIRRPVVSAGLSLWLYFSFFSLCSIWITLGLAALGRYLQIGPFT